MNKKITLLLAALILAACSESKNESVNTAASMQNEAYVFDTHYKNVKEVINPEATKNTVTEFFWYGCPHCKAFEPHLETWEKTKPANITLQRSPAIWNETMALHAKLFFIASTMDKFEALHKRLFEEVINLRGKKDLAIQTTHFANVFAEFGLQENDFKQHLASPEIQVQVEQAHTAMKASGLTGTPTIMVNGKYLILNDGVKSHADIMAVADFLIAKEK
ncbi:MAG: thiol:disulfide interchange protein DsbA/DsbL [Pseudomonadales bacterium]|nr:thiol:disulfide interchange protein DsbA/DsbL [Pseudomonadales bacterium]